MTYRNTLSGLISGQSGGLLIESVEPGNAWIRWVSAKQDFAWPKEIPVCLSGYLGLLYWFACRSANWAIISSFSENIDPAAANFSKVAKCMAIPFSTSTSPLQSWPYRLQVGGFHSLIRRSMRQGQNFPAHFASAPYDTPANFWNTFSENETKKLLLSPRRYVNFQQSPIWTCSKSKNLCLHC